MMTMMTMMTIFASSVMFIRRIFEDVHKNDYDAYDDDDDDDDDDEIVHDMVIHGPPEAQT
eukprot:11522236-Karenia_brevis.AAC.1